MDTQHHEDDIDSRDKVARRNEDRDHSPDSTSDGRASYITSQKEMKAPVTSTSQKEMKAPVTSSPGGQVKKVKKDWTLPHDVEQRAIKYLYAHDILWSRHNPDWLQRPDLVADRGTFLPSCVRVATGVTVCGLL